MLNRLVLLAPGISREPPLEPAALHRARSARYLLRFPSPPYRLLFDRARIIICRYRAVVFCTIDFLRQSLLFGKLRSSREKQRVTNFFLSFFFFLFFSSWKILTSITMQNRFVLSAIFFFFFSLTLEPDVTILSFNRYPRGKELTSCASNRSAGHNE